jgi:hypothetical protein
MSLKQAAASSVVSTALSPSPCPSLPLSQFLSCSPLRLFSVSFVRFCFSCFFISSPSCLSSLLSVFPYGFNHFLVSFFCFSAFLFILNYFTISSIFPSLSLYLYLFYFISFPSYFFLISLCLISLSFHLIPLRFNFVLFLLALFISSCHAIAQAISRRLPTAMAQVRSQVTWDS